MNYKKTTNLLVFFFGFLVLFGYAKYNQKKNEVEIRNLYNRSLVAIGKAQDAYQENVIGDYIKELLKTDEFRKMIIKALEEEIIRMRGERYFANMRMTNELLSKESMQSGGKNNDIKIDGEKKGDDLSENLSQNPELYKNHKNEHLEDGTLTDKLGKNFDEKVGNGQDNRGSDGIITNSDLNERKKTIKDDYRAKNQKDQIIIYDEKNIDNDNEAPSTVSNAIHKMDSSTSGNGSMNGKVLQDLAKKGENDIGAKRVSKNDISKNDIDSKEFGKRGADNEGVKNEDKLKDDKPNNSSIKDVLESDVAYPNTRNKDDAKNSDITKGKSNSESNSKDGSKDDSKDGSKNDSKDGSKDDGKYNERVKATDIKANGGVGGDLVQADRRANDKNILKEEKKERIQLVYFFDYNCPFCKLMHETIYQLAMKFPDLDILYREIPALGKKSILATRYSIAVKLMYPAQYYDIQGKLFALQDPSSLEEIFHSLKKAHIDPLVVQEFLDDAANYEKVNKIIEAHINHAHILKINGTPAIAIDGNILSGKRSVTDLENLIMNVQYNKAK